MADLSEQDLAVAFEGRRKKKMVIKTHVFNIRRVLVERWLF